MINYSCDTCGTQYAASASPPGECIICSDERQYVGWNGQRWTTQEDLRHRHRIRIEEYHAMLALTTEPAFAIGQRSLLLRTDAGNVLWETLPFVTDAAIEEINRFGGVDMIAISHPHFYAAMIEWSKAFADAPILLPEADRRWVAREDGNFQFWSTPNDRLSLSPSVTLIRCGGHFEGSSVLHWADGPRAGGGLFSGDTLQVAMDRRNVSFMHSYPNAIPLGLEAVNTIRSRLTGVGFEDVFGYSWGRDILGDGRNAVDRSFDRYFRAVGARSAP